jgi:hypothetical protein
VTGVRQGPERVARSGALHVTDGDARERQMHPALAYALTEDHGVRLAGVGGAQRAAGRPAASQAFMPPATVATSSRCRAARRAATALR